jgi:hypothetical protein
MLMKKTAILQMADAGPAESTELMLRSVGYQVFLPNKKLRDELRRIGCDTVLSPRDLTAGMGYDPVSIPEIGPEGMDRCDLYCDIKAHRCYDKIAKRWPRLKGKVLWGRINGGRMEHVIKPSGEDCGDEVNPPCPILTPNLWYKDISHCVECGMSCHLEMCEPHKGPTGEYCFGRVEQTPWAGRAYACWPPFVRFDEYDPRWRQALHCDDDFTSPICLIHNANGWGYGALIPNMRQMGVRVYGAGSPDGLIPHSQVKKELSRALCMVHLKSSDAPGYSLLESLAAGCPVVCTRRLIWRCRMESLLIPDETCLVFDRETHDGLTPKDVEDCAREVAGHLERLRDPAENRRIGMNGRDRLKEVMWSPNKEEDVASLREFMRRHFP